MFSSVQHSCKEILECFHSYLWGPSHVKSHGGCQYFVTFVNDYLRKTWVYFLKIKDEDEMFGWLKEWETMVKKLTENHVRPLRTENGLGFCMALFDNFCKT